MRNSKIFTLFAACCMLVWMSGCSPEQEVAPNQNMASAPSVGAFGNAGNDEHPQPTSPCGEGMRVPIVNTSGDTLYDFNQLPYGEIQLLNNDTIVWLGLVLNPALFTDLATWYVGDANNAPTTANGDFDLENFPNQGSYPYANVWAWSTETPMYGQCNDWVTYFEVFQVSFFGGPNEATREGVWAGQTPSGNGYIFNYCKDNCGPVCDTVVVTNSGYSNNGGGGNNGGGNCGNGHGNGHNGGWGNNGHGNGHNGGGNNCGGGNNGHGNGHNSGWGNNGWGNNGHGNGHNGGGNNCGGGNGHGNGHNGGGNGWNNSCNTRITAEFNNCDNTVFVNSNRRLEKVTLLFDDCTTETVRTNRDRGTFEGTGVNAGKTIVGIWVKNGCGGDCWAGEFMSQSGQSLEDLGCTCPPRNGGGGGGGGHHGGGNC